MPQLKQLTKELGLESRVQFKQPLPIDQVPTVMAAADVGVEPKLAIGFSDEAWSTRFWSSWHVAFRWSCHGQPFTIDISMRMS